MKTIWISNKKFTCQVESDKNNCIVNPAPILKKFAGQHVNALVCWLEKKFPETIISIKENK